MTRAVKGLDHVVVMVDGIDAAEAAYRRLGFQVQPRGFHRKLGTANHLMIFDKDYFEILGIVEDTEFNAERRAWLKNGGGLANVALATDGADLAFDAFRKAGLQPDAPLLQDSRDNAHLALKAVVASVLMARALSIFSLAVYSHFCFSGSAHESSSTSNLSVAPPGILGPDPLSPYA